MSITLAGGGFQNRLARLIALMRASKCLDEVVEVDDVVEDGLGWDGMGWDGMGWAGLGWTVMCWGWAELG